MDLEWCKRSAQLGNKVWGNLQLAWERRRPLSRAECFDLPLNQTTELRQFWLERGLVVKDKQCKNRSCDWLNEKPRAAGLSAWTLSEDGDLVCACDQTELLYHSVTFTCKVGFHSSVIVCSWYPSLGKYFAFTEMNDLSVAWAVHKWIDWCWC